MKNKDLITRINYLYNKADLNQNDIFEMLTYQERVEIFYDLDNPIYKKYKLINDFIEKCNSMNLYLFNEQEFSLIKGNNTQVLKLKLNIPPKETSRHFLLYDGFESMEDYNRANFSKLSDEEIVNIINGLEFNNHPNTIDKIIYLIPFFKSDLLKHKYLEKYFDFSNTNSELTAIVLSFNADNYKQYYLPKVKDKFRVVMSLKDEKTKVKCLKYLNKQEKQEVLLSIHNEDIIKSFLKKPLISKKIMVNLVDDELKESYFKKYLPMISFKDRGSILASFNSKKKQIELLNNLKSEQAIFNYLIAQNVLSEKEIFDIAIKLKSDEKKIKILNYIKNDILKNEILKSIKNINVIIANLDAIDSIEQFKKIIFDVPGVVLKKVDINKLPTLMHRLTLLKKINDKKYTFELIEKAKDLFLVNPSKYEDLDYFIDLYANEYSLNKEHLKLLVTKIGFEAFKFLKNDNIKNAINFDDENFNKYLEIFNYENFNASLKNVKDLLFAFSQEQYRTSYKDIINICDNILKLMKLEQKDEALKNIRKVLSFNDANRILSLFGTKDLRESANIFLNQLIKKDNGESINLLHELSNYMIDKHRIQVTSNLFDNSIQKIHKKLSNKGLIDYYIFSDIDLQKHLMLFSSFLSEEENVLINDNKRLESVISFKKSPSNDITNLLKKDLKIFDMIISKINNPNLLKNVINYDTIVDSNLFECEINYGNKKDTELLLSIMSETNSLTLAGTLFNENDLYDKMLNFLKSTKILGIDEHINSRLNSELKGSLITNFADIDDNYKDNSERTGIINYINGAAYFDSPDNRMYDALLGRKAYYYLKNDPGPNYSHFSSIDKMKQALKLIKDVKSRKYLTVPPQEKVYKTKNSKKINVSIGEVNSFENLIVGEQTGSCMRLGGVGDSFWKFCLLNPSGFNIFFRNPETGEFISRVSCFRNGNTVFINELRESVDKNYNSKDLSDVLVQAANTMIEQTKDSEFPIENVVVSNERSLKNNTSTVNLNIDDARKGYKNFYSNIITRKAIVLATNAKNKAFTNVKLSTNLPLYKASREKVKYLEGNKAAKEVIHLKALQQFMSGNDIQLQKEKVIACYAGQDWVIYVTNDYKIHHFYDEKNKEAMKEIKNTIDLIKKNVKFNEDELEKNYKF